MNAAPDLSPAMQTALSVVDVFGLDDIDGAHAAVDAFLDASNVIELAAHEYDWSNVWARPKQLAPLGFDWEFWGFLCGRGFGKTIAVSKFINAEVEAGRAKSICLMAQNEDNAIKLLVLGPSGLIATAPPWFKPQWEAAKLELVWPDGSRAYVRSPEVPDNIRGFDYDLAWLTEVQSWPATTRAAAMMNVELATRVGLARIVWDATARARHPLLKRLLKDNERDPKSNVIVRGSTYENASNLATGYIAKIESAVGGTTQGDEELEGRMGAEGENVTAKQDWIDRNRRTIAGVIVRRVISVDPAVTSRAGSDNTGIVDVGLSVDGKALILGDYTDKHPVDVWATKTLELYVSGRCDLVVVETNKGGDLVTRNLRAAAKEQQLVVVLIGKKEEAPGHQKGVVHVREIFSKGQKADRARPLSTAIQKNRVGFVGMFPLLEETLTTWEPTPGARSPDRLDATVAGVVEVLGLDVDEPATDPKAAFKGIVEANRSLATPPRAARRGVGSLFGGSNDGGRI